MLKSLLWRGAPRARDSGQRWRVAERRFPLPPFFLPFLLFSSLWRFSTPASSPREAQGPRNAWLATCHAWSCHKLCANLTWRCPWVREMRGKLMGHPWLPRGSVSSWIHAQRWPDRKWGTLACPTPQQLPKRRKIFLHKSIACKWCQNIPPFCPATSPGVSVCPPVMLFPSSPFSLRPPLGGGEWFPSAAWTVTGAPLLAPRWLSVGCPLLGCCRILGPPPWRFWEPPALRPEVGLCLITAAKWLISSQWPIWRFNSSRSCFG